MAKRKPKFLQLKIVLDEIEPEIWRRVLVPTNLTLHDLHRLIQLMFDWYDYHLYEFTIAGTRYGVPDADAEEETEDSTRVRLRDVAESVGDHFTYIYDFGDDWVHTILVERAPQRADPGWLPYVLSGERAGPPEDCGGVDGFQRFLEALRDPDDPEHEEYRTWIGANYDPELFDVRAVRHSVLLSSAWGQA
jgi:hypothetical protein